MSTANQQYSSTTYTTLDGRVTCTQCNALGGAPGVGAAKWRFTFYGGGAESDWALVGQVGPTTHNE